jgi:hypothetical protein
MSEEDRVLNQSLLEEVKKLTEDFEKIKQKMEDRKLYLKERKEFMDVKRDDVYHKIDEYYDLLVRKIEQKRQQVKEDYKSIESGEKRRLGFIQLQVQNTQENIKEAENDLHAFADEFDLDMDQQANRAGYERVKDRFEEVREEQERKTHFLKNSEFVPPTFETVSFDVDEIMDFGRVIDNNEFSEPLIVMNTYNFELLEYQQNTKEFETVLIRGKHNIR